MLKTLVGGHGWSTAHFQNVKHTFIHLTGICWVHAIFQTQVLPLLPNSQPFLTTKPSRNHSSYARKKKQQNLGEVRAVRKDSFY